MVLAIAAYVEFDVARYTVSISRQSPSPSVLRECNFRREGSIEKLSDVTFYVLKTLSNLKKRQTNLPSFYFAGQESCNSINLRKPSLSNGLIHILLNPIQTTNVFYFPLTLDILREAYYRYLLSLL